MSLVLGLPWSSLLSRPLPQPQPAGQARQSPGHLATRSLLPVTSAANIRNLLLCPRNSLAVQLLEPGAQVGQNGTKPRCHLVECSRSSSRSQGQKAGERARVADAAEPPRECSSRWGALCLGSLSLGRTGLCVIAGGVGWLTVPPGGMSPTHVQADGSLSPLGHLAAFRFPRPQQT